MRVHCLECDRNGGAFEVAVNTGADLDQIARHYSAAHPDVDLDALPDAEIVTLFPTRLKARR